MRCALVIPSILPPIVQINHHLAHAASAFGASGFQDAAILVMDNRGEDASTTLFVGNEDGIEELERFPVADSLGIYYRSAAEYAGLCGVAREVGKFMGLASYGKPNQPVPVEIIDDHPIFTGLPSVDGVRGGDLPTLRVKQFLDFFVENCFPNSVALQHDTMSYAHFAASVQASLEAAEIAFCRRLKRRSNSTNLALAGGVALNCTANMHIAQSGLYRDVFIPPVAHDSGVALGAALEVDRRLQNGRLITPFRMEHALWGPSFNRFDIETCLTNNSLPSSLLDEDTLVATIADLLADGQIVAWFQGRAEIGPRALGARSLLGDPRRRSTLERLNLIKQREMWRPLAPSVLSEFHDIYFDSTTASKFMLSAAVVRPEVRAKIPAVVHFDGTARPQSVDQKHQPRYWKLIKAFYDRTGIPILVNTSFNIQGEPIVQTPEDAVRTFGIANIDALAIGDRLVQRPRTKFP